MKNNSIIVVGGGHAGVEASLAIANIGIDAILVTMDINSIGRMSCNPAIGGLGKGHLVKEIDALGGIMGRAADICGLQFKTLNTSKGRAVWSPRAQIDKKKYSSYIQKIILAHNNIRIVQDEVVDFSVNNSVIDGAYLRNGGLIKAGGLIVCSGTFMNGIIHVGSEKYSAGRLGERACQSLTISLINSGFYLSRLKTGTPPRLLSSSLEWNKFKVVDGDKAPTPFSILTNRPFNPQNISCYTVNTNPDVHKILKNNLSKSAMYSGKIEGVGPRYCPSIEDKVIRFNDKDSHLLFLEPEWAGSNQIYINGFSTSMPRSVQRAALRKIPGLENSEIIRPGYAIEYDYFSSSQLKSTLETKSIGGLYFAGQLNGTSGYEEAAAQGLVAGANAALRLLDKDPIVLGRDLAYVGVLIDDLITKDINEPYRMFTSSAEHRLFLRPENAPLRLTNIGYSAGIVSKKQYDLFKKFESSFSKIKRLCRSSTIFYGGKKLFLASYLKRPGTSIHDNNIFRGLYKKHSSESFFAAETDIKYEGYVKIESMRVDKLKKMENIKIPVGFDYSSLPNISTESKEKLVRILPETLGQANRIAGVRPSDVSILAIYLNASL